MSSALSSSLVPSSFWSWAFVMYVVCSCVVGWVAAVVFVEVEGRAGCLRLLFIGQDKLFANPASKLFSSHITSPLHTLQLLPSVTLSEHNVLFACCSACASQQDCTLLQHDFDQTHTSRSHLPKSGANNNTVALVAFAGKHGPAEMSLGAGLVDMCPDV